MRPSVRRRSSCVGAFLSLAATLSAVGGVAHGDDSYLGVGSCASSQCHGSAAPRRTSSVLQNEYSTWHAHDPHAKAWRVLSNEDSKKIARHLGIADATQEKLCLDCHSTYVSAERRGSAFSLEDGVGCETCHGAAERWLGPHSARDASHRRNVELGMKELSGPQEQSALCLSCHFGTEDKQVNHRLIGAGHPRLSFELDTFQSIQPRHWAIDTDYGQRKQPYLPVRSWFVSQVVQGESSLQRLLSEKRSRQGIFPEFALFSCTACHHSLVEEQWKKREYGGQPGIPHLNLASLVMVREALAVIEPRSATQFDKSLDTLHEAYVVGGPAVSGAVTTLLQKLHQLRSASALEQVNDTATARRLLARMVEFAASKRFATYEEAEQIAMAVSTFSAAIEPDGSLHRREIDALYLELKDPKAFDPGAFQQAAARFSQAL